MPYNPLTQPCRYQHPDPIQTNTVRLSRKQAPVLRQALTEYHQKLHSLQEYAASREVMAIIRAIPDGAPYDFALTGRDWVLVSLALRPEGSHPTAGSFASKCMSIYRYFIKHQSFRVK